MAGSSAVTADGLWPRLLSATFGRSADASPDACPGCLTSRRTALRSAVRCRLPVAQRRGARDSGRRTRRAQRRSPDARLCQVCRWRRQSSQHAHRRRPAGLVMTPPRPCLQRDSPHAYPTATGIWPPVAASSCTGREQARDTIAPLSWCFGWWQVQGSNLGRLSRRFYRPLPLATRATCQMPPCGAAERRIADYTTGCDVDRPATSPTPRGPRAADVTIGTVPV
jgi:hypothetical protein